MKLKQNNSKGEKSQLHLLIDRDLYHLLKNEAGSKRLTMALLMKRILEERYAVEVKNNHVKENKAVSKKEENEEGEVSKGDRLT